MYYLHYLRFTLDERKTLTKISTRKPLTTVPQTSAHLGRQLEGKQQVIQKRAVCIVRGENKYCTPCRASPIVRPPTQMVAPMPQQNEDEAAPEVQARPVDPPTQAEAPSQEQERSVDPPSQVEAPPSDGHTAATAVEISDSDSE